MDAQSLSLQVKRGGTATTAFRNGYPHCTVGTPQSKKRRSLSVTDDRVDHALVERRFLEASKALDGIVELIMIDLADCPKGYHMIDRHVSLSGNLQQGRYTDTPSFLCVKFGAAADHAKFLLDIEVVPQKRGCSTNFKLVTYTGTAQAAFNDAYKVSICAKYGEPDSVPALSGLYLSADETCPPYYTAMGLRGSNYASDFNGNLNHNSYPGIAVYMCQSTTAFVPPLQAGKNESLVIIGAHFAKKGNEVRVGENQCNVTKEGIGRIECDVGEGIGNKQVTVIVPKVGLAQPRPHKDPNVALGRPVRINGNVHGGYGGTKAMVDGISYTNAYNCGGFSRRGGQLYMIVDIGQIEQVHHVMLYAYDKMEAHAGARVFVGPYPTGGSIPFKNQDKMTECTPPAGAGVFTADNLYTFDCGGGINAQYVIVEALKGKNHLYLCEIEIYAEARRPREFARIVDFETGVQSVNGVKCRGDRPCVQMTLSGHGYGSSEDLRVSIKTASGFKLCDVKSHTSTGINCVSSARPRMTDYQCQKGPHLDRRHIIHQSLTDSALECMTKCTSASPACQSLMWNSAHRTCYLSSAPRLPKASSGCDNTVANLDGGNDKCCTANNQCNINEGRCQGDGTCRAGLKCRVKCYFNNEDTCCADAEGSYSVNTWLTCSNPSVVLDEGIVTFSRKTDGRKIATATFGMEWNNDMSPVIESVTAPAITQSKAKSCSDLGWLTKMGLPVCGLVHDLENQHYTPVDNGNRRQSAASHSSCQAGSMIDGKGQAWCAVKSGSHDTSLGHITMDLLNPEVVSGVVTQGRDGHNQYVTQVKVALSIDGKDFKFVVDDKGDHVVFSANKDQTSKVYNKFKKATKARYVRVFPWDVYKHASMRVGVMLKARKMRTVYTKCMAKTTFDTAKKQCEGLGGRMCTSKEVYI